LSIGAGDGIGPREAVEMRLLERLLELSSMATLAAIYNDVVEAINDGGDDLDDARKLLEILDDHAADLGASDVAELLRIGRD
jgi:hypothetical protein